MGLAPLTAANHASGGTPMPDTSDLDYVTALIEQEWGRPIAALEERAVNRPAEDPLLQAVMRIRAVVVADSEINIRMEQLHGFTRPGTAPAYFDLERITEAAVKHQVVRAESRTALQAVVFVIDARKTAAKAADDPGLRRVRAAVSRSEHVPRRLGLPPDQPAPPAPAAPTVAATRPGR